MLLPFLLAACGFEPMYAKQSGKQNALLAGVRVEGAPPGRLGQQFRIALEDQLNPEGVMPVDPLYRIQVTFDHTEAAIDTARDGTVSRYNVYLNSNYKLYRISDGVLMTSGSLRHVSSYNNITNEYFSTYVAQEDALERGIVELGKLYRQRLAVYLTQNGGNPKPQVNAVPDAPPPPVPVPLTPGMQDRASPPITRY